MKAFFSTLIICICLVILGVDGYFLRRALKGPQTVHLYFDLASTPSLLQMIEFLQADPDDPKFFAWRRYPERSKRMDMNALNALEIKLPTNLPQLGNNRTESLNANDRLVITRSIAWIFQQYPNAQYVVHLNRRHLNIVGTNIFQMIPLNQIKRLHIYEDGHGEVAKLPQWRIMRAVNTMDMKEFKKRLTRQVDSSVGSWDAFLLQELMPVTYHLGFYENIQNNPEKANLAAYLNKAQIVNVSFDELRKTLSPEIKRKLYMLFDVDETLLNELRQPKTVLFTFGTPLYPLKPEIVTALKEGKLFPEIDNSWQFFCKEHPWLTGRKVADMVKKKHPDIKALPKQMPLEVLVIADALPQKIIGYSSSFFFSIPPEKILAYIPSPKADAYLPELIKQKILTEDKVLRWEPPK